MKKTLLNKNSRTNLITYLVVIVAFAVMQALSSQGKLGSAVTGYLVPVCCYIVLAVSLNLLVGVCGELSLGHAGFMGVGAFSGVILATMLKDSIPSPVLRLVLAMVFGGVLAGVLGFLIGIPVALDALGSGGAVVKAPYELLGLTTESAGFAMWNDCWLDFYDMLTEGIMMPLGALLMSLLMGWVFPNLVKDECEQSGHQFKGAGYFKFCFRFVIPIIMVIVLITQIQSFFL